MDPGTGLASKGDDAPRRPGRRLARGAAVAFVGALAVLAILFLAGVTVPGEFLRAPLERALTGTFGVPTRIEGPLHVRTGLVATATADALVLADPSGPPGAVLARGARPGVRIDLLDLLRRVVTLEEITGERLELALVRADDGRANWAPIFTSAPGGGPPAVTFGGIGRLRIGAVTGTYRSGSADAVPFAISSFEGTLPLRDPATARGTATVAGRTFTFDLRTASLTDLGAPGAATPVQGTVGWSGTRFAVDGAVAPDGARVDTTLQASADDAGALLAALGIAARQPGRLDLRARITVSAADVSASDVALTLGESAVSGRASVGWGGPRMRVTADLAGERVDVAPFLGAEPSTDKTAAEVFVELLERAATGIDGEIRASASELVGLPLTVHAVQLEGRSTGAAVALRSQGILSGTRTTATLDYDARKPQRVLAARLEGGAVSTARLPREARPGGVAGTTGAIRGEARGQGASPRAVVASLQMSLEARDLRWTTTGRGGEPLSGRFDTIRVAVQGGRASSAEVAGKLGDVACTLKASGGALAPLLEGTQWPVQLAGACPGVRLNAKGRIAIAARHVAADLAFNASADRIGPIAQALGVSPRAPHAFAARGTLALDEKLAHVKLGSVRLGRTAGSGEAAFPLGRQGAPNVHLALATLDFVELNSLADPAPATSDPLDREVFRENLRLPDADFRITAERVALAGETLRRMHVSGTMRARRLPPTAFGFEWSGAPVSGTLGADFSGATPRVQLDAAAQNVDLRALTARLGFKAIALRAGMLSVRARSEGSRVGELLAAAMLDAALERGRLDLGRAAKPGLPRQAEFSATLKAAPGQPAALAARGTLGAEPFDVTLDSPGLAGLARAGAPIPATMRATLGDIRFQAAGTFVRDGTGDARVELSGARLDRLGRLAGMDLPEVGPYAARGTVVVAADAVRAADLEVSVGKSRVHGKAEFQIRRAGRATHSAALRAPALHLEDLGAARWLGGPVAKADAAAEGPAAQREAAWVARAIEWVRRADLDAAIEVDALRGGGEHFASGRLRATAAAGRLRAELQDVKTAGGRIDADLRIDASGAQPNFAARVRVDGLEFGPLARALDPATKLGGSMDLVADLATQGAPGQLLPAVSGTIDTVMFPHDLRPGVLTFWGTGLLGTLLGTLDPSGRSEVECAVASLDFGGGVASTSAFFVDTTRVRIVGQLEMDLATHALSGRLRPVSEQPELFTVAPAVTVGGTIESPRVAVAPAEVLLTPLRLATPLATFALDFLAVKGGLREPQTGCREAFERARKLHVDGLAR